MVPGCLIIRFTITQNARHENPFHGVLCLERSERNGYKDDYIEAAKQLLKGDYGFMCQYDNEPDFETVWSSIFDLKSLAIYRAEGDPRKKKFVSDHRLQDVKVK